MKRFIILSALCGVMCAANAQSVVGLIDFDNGVTADELKANQTVSRESAKADDGTPVYSVVEQPPTFPGGEMALMKYIATHIKYPMLAQEYDVQGMVGLKFVVMEDGSVGEVNVVKSMRQDIAAMSKEEYTASHPNATDEMYDRYLADFKSTRQAEADCEAEAVRVVKSLPRFIPGKQQGKPVRVWFSLPIRFQLQ